LCRSLVLSVVSYLFFFFLREEGENENHRGSGIHTVSLPISKKRGGPRAGGPPSGPPPPPRKICGEAASNPRPGNIQINCSVLLRSILLFLHPSLCIGKYFSRAFRPSAIYTCLGYRLIVDKFYFFHRIVDKYFVQRDRVAHTKLCVWGWGVHQEDRIYLIKSLLTSIKKVFRLEASNTKLKEK
jgi:hypothetical protein